MNTQYNQIRSKIKSGDILAWTHKGWGSWYDFQIQLVRIFTRSEYCHVGVAWVVGDRVFVIEAVSPVVRIYPLSMELPCYLIPIDSYWNDDVEKLALSFVGKPYSKIEAVMGFLGTLTTGADDKWQCAELVNTILTKVGLFKQGEVISTPSEVISALLNRGNSLLLINKDS